MAEKEVRLIDVQQLYNCRTCRHHGHCDFIVTCDHGEMYSPDMSKLETIDPESLRPCGKWIHCNGKSNLWYCSECGNKVLYNPTRRTYNIEKKPISKINKYCRNCGAKMEE